jgi:hypothetical protein
MAIETVYLAETETRYHHGHTMPSLHLTVALLTHDGIIIADTTLN